MGAAPASPPVTNHPGIGPDNPDQQAISFPSPCLRRPWKPTETWSWEFYLACLGYALRHLAHLGLRSACTWATSGGRSSWHTAWLPPSTASWVAGRVGIRGVRQMSWCSGEVKTEAGNLSDRPQQAKLASATGRRLSCYSSLCLKPWQLCTGKKSPTTAPSIWVGADKKNAIFIHYSFNSVFTEGLYCTTQTRCHRGFGGLQSTGVVLKI